MAEARSLEKAKASGGFSWLANSFIDNVMPTLSDLAVIVYLILIRSIHNKRDKEQITRDGIPVSEIARKLKHSKVSIFKALKDLEKAGVIEKIRTSGSSNRYKLLDTHKENLTGDINKTLQGSKVDLTPPDKSALQVNAVNDCETRAEDVPKNKEDIKSIKNDSDEKTHCGFHLRKIP